MKDLIETNVRQLVEHPNDLTVGEVAGDQTSIFELRCNKSDVGKIIGKNGKTIAALRTLMGSIAQKDKRKVVIEVAE